MPSDLRENWADWGLGDVDALAGDVLTRCGEATRAWELTGVEPLAGGNVALVLAAAAPSGAVVLKLSPRPAGASTALEAEALVAWARHGAAPRVLGTRDDGHTLLLERIQPGETLAQCGRDAHEVLETIGRLCPRLHLPAGELTGARFPSLATHAADDGWFRSLAGTREHDELAALVEPSSGDRLLHVDLHALNVLRGPDGWLVIDPKPCLGDPCAEVYGFLDGAPFDELPRERSPARTWLARELAAYARASREDPGRLAAWLRIRAQILLGEGADPKREALLRLRDALE